MKTTWQTGKEEELVVVCLDRQQLLLLLLEVDCSDQQQAPVEDCLVVNSNNRTSLCLEPAGLVRPPPVLLLHLAGLVRPVKQAEVECLETNQQGLELLLLVLLQPSEPQTQDLVEQQVNPALEVSLVLQLQLLDPTQLEDLVLTQHNQEDCLEAPPVNLQPLEQPTQQQGLVEDSEHNNNNQTRTLDCLEPTINKTNQHLVGSVNLLQQLQQVLEQLEDLEPRPARLEVDCSEQTIKINQLLEASEHLQPLNLQQQVLEGLDRTLEEDCLEATLRTNLLPSVLDQQHLQQLRPSHLEDSEQATLVVGDCLVITKLSLEDCLVQQTLLEQELQGLDQQLLLLEDSEDLDQTLLVLAAASTLEVQLLTLSPLLSLNQQPPSINNCSH